jgi:hypothetical protein
MQNFYNRRIRTFWIADASDDNCRQRDPGLWVGSSNHAMSWLR